MKVCYLTNTPVPYRVDFLNEFGKYVDLTVLFQRNRASNRVSEWYKDTEKNYKEIILKGKAYGEEDAFCPEVVKYLTMDYDVIVICGVANLTYILAIEWCKLKRIPYYMAGDGAFVKDGKSFKEWLKKKLIQPAKLGLSTCNELDKYYAFYGLDPTKIRRYHFSSLTASHISDSVPDLMEKKKLREELGISGNKVVLSVGQFIPRKGIDVLLKAASRVREDALFLIIGGEPTEEYKHLIEELQLKNVSFLNFQTPDVLLKYYRASDVLAFPTREDIWGLVVAEALNQGLPVISTNRCNAALELIRDGENGYIVPVEDAEKLAEAIDKVLSSEGTMETNARLSVRDYNIENMAKEHFAIFRDYLCETNKNA